MKRSLLASAAIVVALATGCGGSSDLSIDTGSAAAPTGAVPSNVVHNTAPAAQSGGATWSPERMAAAKPMFKVKDGVEGNSFGTANLDFTRSRITPQTANVDSPYKTVGKLFFKSGGSDFVCSASVIGRRLVVTAAHCMYTRGVGFHTNWLFVPGYDGTKPNLAQQRPFGTWDWSFGVIPQNWINTGGALPNRTDFGLLVMRDQSFGGSRPIPITNKTGQMTYALNHLFDTHVTALGYPCNLDACRVMQRVDSSDHRPGSTAANNNAWEYGSDMTGGSSGGPWVENFGNPAGAAPTGGFNVRNTVVAVTSYGYTDPNVRIQGASGFNSDFTTIRNTACNQAAGNC